MLKVNEVFGPTHQGEGKSAGLPCAFLRLALCQFWCGWCDTPHTWNWVGTDFSHPDKYKYEDEVHEMTDEQVISKISSLGVQALVISGGEPLLQHKQLVSLCEKLPDWWLEIETNGGLMPNQKLISLVDQINCSPKLANSGMPEKVRIKPNVLSQLAQEEKVNFKFVISSAEDVDEVLDLVARFEMKEVRLMPEAISKEELNERSLMVRRLCEQHDFIFSTRLSIMTSGTTRGV